MSEMDIFKAVESENREQILKHVSQINDANQEGNTPLMVAIQRRSVELIKLLIDNGADINARNKIKDSALHLAVKEGRVENAALLIDNGADVNARSEDGSTPLLYAVMENSLPVAQLLLQKRANAKIANQVGTSLLVSAAYKGLDDIVCLLLQHDVDVNSGTVALDNTALLWAAQKCSHATVKALLDAGAMPSIKSKNGSSPLSQAKDDLMKRLIREYLQVGGPSWIVRELSARGLSWEQVCNVQDQLAKVGIRDKASLLSIPCARFDESGVRAMGIYDPLSCKVLRDLRLQSTWLGAHLARHDVVSCKYLVLCEMAVVEDLGCYNETCFAQTLPEELSDAYLVSKGIQSGVVRRCLRQVHEQVRGEKNVVTVAVSAESTSAAAALVEPAAPVERESQSAEEAGQEEGSWDVCE